jgi:hypothetical protein
MASTAVTSTFATPHSKNAWAATADTSSWHKVKGISTDGVSNTFLLLALARANGKTVHTTYEAGSNEITAVYL